MQTKRDIAFTSILLIIVVAAVWTARDWELKARLFPWVVGIPLIVLLLLQLALSVRTMLATPRGATVPHGGLEQELERSWEEELEPEGDPAVTRRRLISISAWLVGFTVLIWAFGFPFGGTLGTLLYLRFTARENWKMTTWVTAGTAAFFWITTLPWLGLPYPQGFVFAALNLPF